MESPLGREIEVVIDNQTFTLHDTVNGSPMCAVARWSMLRTREADHRLKVIATDAGHDAGVIATDLRIELLSDDLYNRMTRGVEIILHEYEAFDGPSERCRASVAQGLSAEVIGQAMTWPITW